MIYVLKHFDTPLLRFSVDGGAEPDLHILWLDEEQRHLLPLDLESPTEKGMEQWICHRSIPRNRAYVDTILSAMGLSINRPFDIMKVSKGLSLNDCYWITEEGFSGTFAQYNLYDNRFSRVLGEIAFTGYGSRGVSGISSSPELTTNGMLPKCWRRENGIIRLYKGGTEGASNTGCEPYSEFYASQIGKKLGFNVVPYGLAKWKGQLCSTCELFTDKALSFVPVGKIVRTGGLKAVRTYFASLGPEFEKALNDMFVMDAVILNTDRHYGNFGVLVDAQSNRIVAPAPLFDHGNSLLNFAARDALTDEKALRKYADTLLPCVYDDFIEQAKEALTHAHRNSLRGLLDFRFERHSRYNLPKKRLEMVEHIVHEQASVLLR